jgi:hypothetical protein
MTEDARYKYNFIALAPKTVIACMNLEPFIWVSMFWTICSVFELVNSSRIGSILNVVVSGVMWTYFVRRSWWHRVSNYDETNSST